MNFFKLFFLTIFLFSMSLSFSQDRRIMVKPDGEKLWGYCDKHGRMVIEAQYKKCYSFAHDGHCFVKDKKGKMMVIDKSGEVVAELPSNYTVQLMKRREMEISPFNDNERWGGIKSNGQIYIKPKYEFISSFSIDGFATAKLDEQFFVVSGGSEQLVQVPDIKAIKRVSEGMIPYKNEEGKFGFLNKSGNEVIKCQFTGSGHFENGVCWVRLENGKIGFIDKKGEFVIEPQFKSVKNFDISSGLAVAKFEEGDWVHINMKGEIVKPKVPIDIAREYHGGFSKVRKDDLFGFIDKKGEWFVEPKYEAVGKFINGWCAVKSNGLWGFIDETGKEVIKPKFRQVRRAVDLKE